MRTQGKINFTLRKPKHAMGDIVIRESIRPLIANTFTISPLTNRNE